MWVYGLGNLLEDSGGLCKDRLIMEIPGVLTRLILVSNVLRKTPDPPSIYMRYGRQLGWGDLQWDIVRETYSGIC